jgi:tight adherence protein B
MSPMSIVAGVFALVLALVLGSYWLLVLRPEGQANRDIRRRLKTKRPSIVNAQLEKARQSLSAVGPLDFLLSKAAGLAAPLQQLIGLSALRVTVGTVVLGSVFCAVVAFAILIQFVPALVALGLGLLAGGIPYAYIKWAASKRLLQFEEQFPEAIDLVARALRAGHALPTALQMVGEEISDPVGGEFKVLFDQQNYGMSLPEALRAFSERVPLLDARFFVTAVMTQREMGGNLSEVLDKLSAVIRERFKVKRQVRAVSAHGRITGVVLGFLPPAVATLLFIVSPAHIRLLVEDPLGLYMVAGAITLQVVGVLAIRKIVNVEY